MLNQNLSKMYKLLNDIITINIFNGDKKIEIEIPYKVKRKDVFFKVLHNGVVTYHNQKPVCIVHKGVNIDLSIITYLLDTQLFNTTVPLYALKGIYSISYKLNSILYVIQIKESDLELIEIKQNKRKLPLIKYKNKQKEITNVNKSNDKSKQLSLFKDMHYNISDRYFTYLNEFKTKYPEGYNDVLFMLKRGSYKCAFFKMLTLQFEAPYMRKNHQFDKLFIKLNENPLHIMLLIMKKLHDIK